MLRYALAKFSGDTPFQQGSLCVQIAGPRLAAIQVTITPSDPVSATTPVAPVTEIEEDSAYTEANDSLQVLLLHGKRQGTEMDASGSVNACAEAGALLLCLTDIAGMGMQVEDDLGDLADTQVSEPGEGYHLSTGTRCCGSRPASCGKG